MTVRVLASAAGLIVVRAELDVTGEDFTISYKGVVGQTHHPKIEIQVKSWSRHEGYLAVKGVHDLLLAAAISAVSTTQPTVLPSQKPQSAKGFLDQVRLGQLRAPGGDPIAAG